jgi:hypothetical protein
MLNVLSTDRADRDRVHRCPHTLGVHEGESWGWEVKRMTILLAVLAVIVVVAVGVGAMLYSDRREHKRAIENGVRR